MQLSDKTVRVIVTICLVTGVLMQTLDTTIANVALPHMQGSLNASQDQIAWVITSYIVANAISVPLTAYLADRYGRKRMLIVALLGFTFTSALCSTAGSIGEMVLYRALQGFSSAWIIPLSQAGMMDNFPADKQTQAITIWSIGGTFGPTLGPTLGGYLTEHFNWRWVFLINVPIGIVASAALLFFMRETERKPGRYFDLLGFGLLGCTVGVFQMMLDRGQVQDWFQSSEIVIETGVAAVALYLFVVHILTTQRPFINLSMYKHWNYNVSLLMLSVSSALPMATMVLMPLLLQNVMGYPVQTVGLLMMPRGLGTLSTMWIVPPLTRRIGARATAGIGLLLMIGAMMTLTTFTTDADQLMIFSTGLLQGFGSGLIFVPLNMIMLGSIERRQITEATAMANVFRSLGSSIGISMMVTLLSQNTQVVRAVLTEYINPFSSSLQNMVGHAAMSNPQQALAMVSGEIDRQAAMTAFIDDFRLLTILTIAILPLLFLLRPTRAPAAPDATAMVEA